MFRNLPRYDFYHQPIGWLEPIPVHWSRRRFGTLLRETDVRSSTGREQLLRVSQYTGVTERRPESGESVGSRSGSLVGYKKVTTGQLAVNIMLAWNGSLGVSSYDGVVSPAYCVYSFSAHLEQWYFHYLLRIPQFKAKIRANSRGIVDSRLRLYSEDLYRIEAAVPPKDEQTAIVKYLAHANARIDKAITAKRRLIALLEEQRRVQNLRHLHGGIKNSEYWPYKRLKWVTRLQRGYDLPADERHSGPYPVISSGGVIATHSESRANGPGVVIGRYGSTGAVFYVDEKFWPHNTALYVTDFQGNDPRWCYWLLRSIDKTVYAEKSAVPGVDRKDLYQISVSVPPLDVQRRVVEQIERDGAEFDSHVKRSQEEISLLQEFRTCLVADVVTGQVDVRAIAATLPDILAGASDLAGSSDEQVDEDLTSTLESDDE